MMSRTYNLIHGDGPELQWEPVIRALPKSVKNNFRVSTYKDVFEAKTPLKTDERIVFLSDHGNSCHLFSDPAASIPNIIETLIDLLPAKKFYFHLSGCELVDPNCTSLFSLMGVDPKILGISGYGKSLSIASAAQIDTALLMCLSRVDRLSYEVLLGLKFGLFEVMPAKLHLAGFKLHIN